MLNPDKIKVTIVGDNVIRDVGRNGTYISKKYINLLTFKNFTVIEGIIHDEITNIVYSNDKWKKIRKTEENIEKVMWENVEFNCSGNIFFEFAAVTLASKLKSKLNIYFP